MSTKSIFRLLTFYFFMIGFSSFTLVGLLLSMNFLLILVVILEAWMVKKYNYFFSIMHNVFPRERSKILDNLNVYILGSNFIAAILGVIVFKPVEFEVEPIFFVPITLLFVAMAIAIYFVSIQLLQKIGRTIKA